MQENIQVSYIETVLKFRSELSRIGGDLEYLDIEYLLRNISQNLQQKTCYEVSF